MKYVKKPLNFTKTGIFLPVKRLTFSQIRYLLTFGYYGRICPFPVIVYLYVVSSFNPIGPLA